MFSLTLLRILSAICVAIDEELCDGRPALFDPKTGVEYDCSDGQERCPAGSYCHKTLAAARCCPGGRLEDKLEFGSNCITPKAPIETERSGKKN